MQIFFKNPRLTYPNLVKFVAITSLTWPFISIIFPYLSSIASSIPIFLGWCIFLYIILFLKFQAWSLANSLLIIGCIAMLSPFALGDNNDLFRSIKTFLSPALFYFIFVKNNQKDFDLLNNIFKIALAISLFGLAELIIRYYFPELGAIWYERLELSGFAGVHYMNFGYFNRKNIRIG